MAVYCSGCGHKQENPMPFCPSCGRKMQPQVGATIDGVLPASHPPAPPGASPLGRVVMVLALLGLVGLMLLAVTRPATSIRAAVNAAIPTPVPPPYRTDSYEVPPLHSQTLTVTPATAPGTMEGYFLVTGGNQDIGFSVQSPSGEYLQRLPRVAGRYDFRYTLPETGPYILEFDNSFSLLTGKVVTLYWRAYWRAAQ